MCGIRKGRPPELTTAEKENLAGWLNGRTPGQYSFDFGLWTKSFPLSEPLCIFDATGPASSSNDTCMFTGEPYSHTIETQFVPII